MQRGAAMAAVMLMSGLVACSEDDAKPDAAVEHPSRLRIRVAVANAEGSEIAVYDVADREVVGRVALEPPATSFVASYTGETALVTSANGRARVFSGGVSVIPHKDHIHIFKSAPQLFGPALEPPTDADPSRVKPLFGELKWTLSYAGDRGAIASFNEDAWLQSKAEVAQATSGATRTFAIAHAGALLAASDTGIDLVSSPTPPTPLSSCPEVSAAASTSYAAVFSCRDGFVVVGTDRAATPVIPFPSAPARSGLVSLHRQPLVLATGAPGKLTVIDTNARSAFAIDAEPDLCDATLEVGPGPFATVLTSGGAVARYDLTTRARVSTAAFTGPFDCNAGTRPHLAATPGRAWVTLPASGELVEIDTVTAREVRRVAIGSSPNTVAVLGLDARNAELGTANDDLTE